MRISTNTMFEMGMSRVADLNSALFKTQQQISTGRKILTPADDPVGAAAALNMTQALAINDQFAINRQNAKAALSQEEAMLQSVNSLLQDVKTTVVNAGNGALDNQQREFLVTSLRSRFDELLSISNSRDSTGNYIFSGYQTNSEPFAKSATGAIYSGDQGQRMLQVGPSRQMSLSDSGSAVFEAITTGNGRFVTAAAATNTGTGIVTVGATIDPSLLTGRDYSVNFTVTAGVTTYDVVDTTIPALVPAPVLPTAVPFQSGQSISFNGMQFGVTGDPANGDTFSVKPSAEQSVFTTFNNLINALALPVTDAGSQARLTNALNTANTNLDFAMDNVSAVRTSIGSRLKEVDSLDSTGAELKIQYAETLKTLQDIDLVEAYSQFTQQQYTLEAAQKSFIQISGLTLFNLL